MIDRTRLADARAKAESLFRATPGNAASIVVFGTGELGRRIVAHARAAGLDVPAACDNNPARWGSQVEDVTILSPQDAVARFGSDVTFVAGIFNPSAVVAQLQRAGVSRIATYPQFFWTYGTTAPAGITGLAPPEFLLEHEAEIGAAYALLRDDESRREYRSQIAWRTSLVDADLTDPSPFADMHFDRRVYMLTERERLVDCGAFDGDSLRRFLAHTGGRFEHAYALEPDPFNRERLLGSVASLPETARDAVTVLPYAASDRSETLRFESGLGVGSVVDTAGNVEVEARKLDDVIDGRPTLVKLDIEGAEPRALAGAAALIEECRPVVAVCAYHYCEHLWELPPLLRRLAPDHEIVLRRYAEQCWETVYYAVPPERLTV